MNPGRLDRKIEIERPVSTPDGGGGRATTWAPFCEAWAEFKRPRTQTVIVQGGVAAIITHEITMRLHSGVMIGWLVHERDRTYKIIGISADDRRYMTLTCEEVVHHAG